MSTQTDYFHKNRFSILKKYANCHNDVYKVKDRKSRYLIVKTNASEESQKLLKNEKDWLEKRKELEAVLEIGLPTLIKSEDYQGQIFLIQEYIQGLSLSKKFKKEELTETDITKLAEFTDRIEGIGYIDTLRSKEKRKLSFGEWDKIFLDNLHRWRNDILKDCSNRIKVIIDTLYEKAKDIHTKDIGLGGIHGSAKLDEFIYTDDGDLYILDWERASSIYINFYQTSSIASYLLIRLKRPDLIEKFLSERERLLDKFQLITYKKDFHKILYQRILGDIYDLKWEGDIESLSDLYVGEFIN